MSKNNDIAVVMPSYNESNNIKILIKRIRNHLPESKIIIVDDSNPMENKKIEKIVNRESNVVLISRFVKSGRGSAVIDGFKIALNDKKMNYIFEMDSDLAHNPNEFERFLVKKDSKKYDLIIGSRYLPGGKIINISPDRTKMSRIINKFLYYWFGIHLTDHTSGFRLYSRQVVEYLVTTDIKSKGFITLSETAYRLFRSGYKISEVPITWNFRRYGKSNVDLTELLKSLLFVILLRLEYIGKTK